MILKGSQRGNAAQLARHLLNLKENEHVELPALGGFASEGLLDALNEAKAIARGTRCKQCLFSLSLSPPPDVAAGVATFGMTIEMVEMRHGLKGLPRAFVFHEEEGRRHAHAVWCRIDHETMTARNLPWLKTRLNDVAQGRRGFAAFTRGTMLCSAPTEPPGVGYAAPPASPPQGPPPRRPR